MNVSFNASQLIVAIGLVGFLVFAGYYFYKLQKYKNLQKIALNNNRSTNWSAKFNTFAQKTYNKVMKVPILNKLVLRIRKRIETLAIYDEYTLRREIMKIAFSITAVIAVFVLLLLIIRPDWLVVFWIMLGAIFITGLLIDFFVHRVESKLLKQLKDFNNRVRFFYQQTKRVEDAIYESIPLAGPEMRIQGEKIYEIITSIEPEKELAVYEEVAPSRFLKVIAGLSLLVKEQGDIYNEKGSAFLRGLSAVNQELNNEILYRSKLHYKLKSLSTLALVPIFFALPIKNWAISKFPIMQSFYDSQIGFISEVTVYGTALIVYFIIRKMREVSETVKPIDVKQNFWEQKLLDKIPLLKKIVVIFSPRPYSKKHFKLTQLIKEANSPLKIEWVTLRRMILGISVFLLLISGLIYAHHREEKSTLYTVMPESFLAGPMDEAERAALTERTEFDREVIEKLRNSNEVISEEKMRTYLAQQLGLDPNDPTVITTYNRIAEKWKIVQNAYLKWWELVICLGVAFAASYIPILSLKFQRYLRYKEMEIEVHQHLVLISILREFNTMSVYMVLEWIERFSIVFKKPLQICLIDFDSGQSEALESLKESITFEPFQNIIERLELAIVRISIKEAFNDIDIEREFYIEQRKENQERSITEKGVVGQIISFIPIMVLVFLYLVIPLIYISVVETNNTLNYFR